jgi:hypothetical protein
MQPPESQVRNYAPLILAVTGLALTGTFINQDPSQTTVKPNKDFDCGLISLYSSKNVSAHWTSGLVIGLSVVLPLLPLVKSQEKANAIVSHALGQSSTFASNEFIKHFLVSPDQSFFEKCNTTTEACSERKMKPFPLKTFCDNSTLPLNELFSSLHSMPDIVFSMLGSSALLFAANIYMWKSIRVATNPINKKVSYFKIIITLFFSLLMAVAVIYQYRQSQNTPLELLVSFLYGAGIQFLIFVLFQLKRTPAIDEEKNLLTDCLEKSIIKPPKDVTNKIN